MAHRFLLVAFVITVLLIQVNYIIKKVIEAITKHCLLVKKNPAVLDYNNMYKFLLLMICSYAEVDTVKKPSIVCRSWNLVQHRKQNGTLPPVRRTVAE